jgi:hypothetical protein
MPTGKNSSNPPLPHPHSPDPSRDREGAISPVVTPRRMPTSLAMLSRETPPQWRATVGQMIF